MSTHSLIQVVEAELIKITDDSNPVRSSFSKISIDSLRRIRTQLQLNTDVRSIVNQLENELLRYAICVKELEQEHIADSNPAAIVLHQWGQSLRIVFDRLREERRFRSEIDSMLERIA